MQPHRFGVFDQDGSIAKENVGKVVDHFCRGARNVTSLPHDIVCRT